MSKSQSPSGIMQVQANKLSTIHQIFLNQLLLQPYRCNNRLAQLALWSKPAFKMLLLLRKTLKALQ